MNRDKLKVYQKKLQTVIDRETEMATLLMKDGKKKQALLALKKRRYQQTLLDKSEGQLANVQELVFFRFDCRSIPWSLPACRNRCLTA